MAAGTLVSLDDIRASVKRFQQEGGRLVDRIRQDATDIVSGRRKPSTLLDSLQQVRAQANEHYDRFATIGDRLCTNLATFCFPFEHLLAS